LQRLAADVMEHNTHECYLSLNQFFKYGHLNVLQNMDQ